MIGLYLIAAHMAGDYLLQTNWMAAKKLTDWFVRFQHCFVYTTCCMVAALATPVHGWRFGAFLLAVFATHFITDSRRWASGEKWPPRPILIDQSLHAVQLAVLGGIFLT